MHYPYKSQRILVGAGATVDIPLDFLPTVGKGGGRMVINRLVLRCSAAVTNPVGVTQESQDIASLIARVTVKDAEGERRDLLGRELRMKFTADMGTDADNYDSPTTIPANATTTRVFDLPIFFRQPRYALRGEDYMLPVDDVLNGGAIQVQTSVVATTESTGGAATSVWNAGSFIQVYAFCTERHDLEYFVRDVVKSYTFASATEFMIPINGRLVRELLWYQTLATEAARDAGAILTLDTYSIVPYDVNTIPVDIMDTWGWTMDLDTLGAHDIPMRPLIYPGKDAKVPDFKLHGGQLLVRFDGSSVAAASTFIVHTISPKSPAMAASAAATAGQNGIDGEVKTAKGGSVRDARAFGAWGRFMSVKQKMAKRP